MNDTMDRIIYRRLHEELVGVQSDFFKHYFEQITKIGFKLYRCSMSICYGEQAFEAVGFGTNNIIAMEEAASSLLDKLMSHNLLNKNLLNIHEQQQEDIKKKLTELNCQLIKDKETIEKLKQRIDELQENERKINEEILSVIIKQPSSTNNSWKQDYGQASTDKIIEELKRFAQSQLETRNELKKLCEEKEKALLTSENEIKRFKDDLTKANYIVRKLHNQLKSSINKVNILYEVAEKQDVAVEDKNKRIKQLESGLRLCLKRLKRKENEINQVKEENKLLRDQWLESKNQIKTNEKVIVWLNKQLNELRLKESNPRTQAQSSSKVESTPKQKQEIKGKVITPDVIKIDKPRISDRVNLTNLSKSRFRPI